jgi:hypothetical protein
MAMPRPRAMIIPICCVVTVTQTKAGYSMNTYTSAGQINHAGMQEIAPQIFDSSNEDLDPGESDQVSNAPFVIASHTLAVRHPFSAFKMTMGQPLDPNVKGVLLTQDEFWEPMSPGFYYYILRNATGSVHASRVRRSGGPSPRKKKSAKKK